MQTEISTEPTKANGASNTTPGTGKRVKTTLGEWGDKLPIGILDSNGQLHKNIVTKPWRTKDERELGNKIGPSAQLVEHVPIIVANMCSQIGPHKMDELDDANKSLVVSTMYLADVFYAYTLLRVKTMGERLHLKINCPRAGCDSEFPYAGDLKSIEVNAVEEIDDILWRYDLEQPITMRHQLVTHFKMAYPKWGQLAHAHGNTNAAEVKAIAIQAAIIGLNDSQDPVALTMHELDELSRPDFEGIQEGIDRNFLGPKMGLEGKCRPEVCTRFKKGGFEFKMPINWAYKDFFGASSRSRQ